MFIPTNQAKKLKPYHVCQLPSDHLHEEDKQLYLPMNRFFIRSTSMLSEFREKKKSILDLKIRMLWELHSHILVISLQHCHTF